MPYKKYKLINFLRCLTDPLIVYDKSWVDVIPQDLKKDIMLSRLVRCFHSGPDNEIIESTEAEAIAYLMTASLSVPLDNTFINIYMKLTKRYLHSRGKPPLCSNEQLEELTEHEEFKVRGLKRWIRERQDNYFHENRRSIRIGSIVNDRPSEASILIT